MINQKAKTIIDPDITIVESLFSLDKKQEPLPGNRRVVLSTMAICAIIAIITLNNDTRGINTETVFWNIWESFGVGLFSLLIGFTIREILVRIGKQHILNETRNLWIVIIGVLLFAQIITHISVLLFGPENRKNVHEVFIVFNWLAISLPLTVGWIIYAKVTNIFRSALRRTIDLEIEAAKLRILQESAEEASRNKSSFLADMSHELRNPLNAIIGYSKILNYDPLTQQQQEYQTIIIDKSQHLLRLINHLLDIEKIESGKHELDYEVVDFENLIMNIVRTEEHQATSKGLRLKAVIESLPEVFIDAHKIEQVLLNLITNAIKFTDHGEITINSKIKDDALVVSIRDEGIGIPTEAQAKIFDKYQQAELDHQRRGTGLGLAISKGFVELHGGKIWVESASGAGATFFFMLPLVKGL